MVCPQPHSSAATKTSRHPGSGGVLLCALVVLFALAAKVSWYHAPSVPTPSIAKLKAFKADLPATSAAPQMAAVVPVTTLPALLAVLALFLVMPAFRGATMLRPARRRAGFSRSTTARPPPAR